MTDEAGEKFWTMGEALNICTMLESLAPKFGCHVALTGGLLYKQGPRKDLDIVLYRIRQVNAIDFGGFQKALAGIGWEFEPTTSGWLHRAWFLGRRVEFLFPEERGGNQDYPPPPGGFITPAPSA